MSTYLRLQIDAMAPKDANLIVKAYEQTLRALSARDGDDPLAEMIAKTIMKVAHTGIQDPGEISAQAIRELEIR
ncbi:hypothetical protein QA635_19530 [Bradyrhizobium brasilense]|uniref:hypothetical protein n=1 Tax=Bradyrhizobium brasilense TaxID=1419277 RepID=UPI0024B07E79|nr:hypothetical protein [Bradyrhizobium australafricanum]WFU36484.1 hypothetical protein QA635_19530 [Bradyrhizobium australafricanum]